MMEFVLKTRANSSASQYPSLPPNGALPKLFPTVSPPSTLVVASVSLLPNGALPKLFPTVSPPSTLSSLPYRSFPTELSPSYFPRFSVHPVVASVSLLPHGALPKLFPTASLPSTLSHRSSPQAISHGFPSVHPVHPVVIPVSLLPTRLSPSYFTWFPLPCRPSCQLPYRSPSRPGSPQAISHEFPFRPPSCRFRIAPSHPSSPQAISHAFPIPSHPLVASVISLLPTGALPQAITRFPFRTITCRGLPYRSFPHGALPELFPTVSLPSTLSSLPYRSFPPSSPQAISTWFPFRPPCRHSRIAPSHRSSPHRSSPQAISHGFPSVHPLVASVSLLPTGTLPKLFHTVSLPSTLSSFLVSLLPTGALPKLFPTLSPRPPSRHSGIAPFHRSSPHAISHAFPSVHPIVTSIRSLPTELPKLFPRFPLRPPFRHFRIAPSRQSGLNEKPKHRRCFWEK